MDRARPHLLALLAYTACALIVTYPLITRLDTHFLANEWGEVDGFLSIWNLWWTGEAIRSGQSPFFTTAIFHPIGQDLFWLWLSLPNGLLVLPAILAAGPLVAYNLTILLSYILGGYCAFLLVRRYVRDDAAALVGGALYALTPFHLRRVLDGVMDTASIQWVPVYLLALHSLIERPRWWKAPLAGALALVVCLGSWYYGLFCLIYTGMAAVVWATQLRAEGRWAPRVDWRRLAWGLAPGVIWALLILPQLIEMALHGDRKFGVGVYSNINNSADLIDFVLPSRFHPLWGTALTSWYAELRPGAWPRQISFGVVMIVLAAVGARARWRESARWLLMLLGIMLLAMGERLQVLGHVTDIPMPYALLANLPGIRTSHRPNHILLLGMLLLALVGSYGIAALMRRWPRARWGLAAGAVAAALLVDGWGGALPLYRLEVPQGYASALPRHTGGAIMPVPVNLNVARSEQLWYQTAHGWPIIGGYTGREPDYPIGRYAPGIRELRYGSFEPDDIIAPGWPEAAREMLAALDVRYVTFSPDLMRDSLPGQRALIAAMGLQPSHREERLEIYPVPRPAAPRTLGYLGAGWGDIERGTGRRWRWLGAEPGELYLHNPHGRPQAVTITLHAEAFERDRPLELRVDGGPPTTILVTRAEMRRQIRLLLAPGQHVVYFSAPADRPEGGRGPLRSISFLAIEVRDGK